MTRLEEQTQRQEFNDWRARTSVSIAKLAAIFFSEPNYDKEQAKHLGRIIYDLHNPFYDVLSRDGKRDLSMEDIIALRILLELNVEDFCKYMKKDLGVSI